MSVGVKKARVAINPCGVDKPAPSVMATNSKPINVAPAVAPTMKKLSQPWSIGVPPEFWRTVAGEVIEKTFAVRQDKFNEPSTCLASVHGRPRPTRGLRCYPGYAESFRSQTLLS